MNDPIFVTGNARSGSTFMQWLLSIHPEIHIHGQELIAWRKIIQMYFDLGNAGIEAEKRNKKDTHQWDNGEAFDFPHWAGSDLKRTQRLFKKFLHDYLCGFGPRKKRWGLKALWLPGDPSMTQTLIDLFPKSKWIICIRHPFNSFESQKNTFAPNENITNWLRNWVYNLHFANSVDNAAVVQIDKLDKLDVDKRIKSVEDIASFIGVETTIDMREFIRKWPIVHKVKEDVNRTFKMDHKVKLEKIKFFPDLRDYMNLLGYN